MKKSDKLLLLFVLIALALFSSAHLNIYWKYKRNDIVSTNHTPLVKDYMVTPKFVVVEGFQNVTLIPSNDFSIEYERSNLSYERRVRFKGTSPLESNTTVHYHFSGDTLVISGLDTIPPQHPNEGPMITPTNFLSIYFKDMPPITQYYGTLQVYADTHPEHAQSFHLLLHSVDMSLSSLAGNKYLYYDQLSITSLGSSINLTENARIKQLQLQLDSSSSAKIESIIGKVSLNYDDNTSFELKGSSLRQLKITPTTN